MVDAALLNALEQLTAGEQESILAVTEFLKRRREDAGGAQLPGADLLAELPSGEPCFRTPDEGLSPARLAARRFLRENPALMRLPAK